MSAYIVEDKTINRAIAYLVARPSIEADIPGPLCACGIDLQEPSAAEHLGAAMFALNIRGVEERYGPGEAAEFRPLDYSFRRELPPDAVHAFKAIQCWFYQCSEGDATKDPLYLAFEDVLRRLAVHIVNNLPAYDKAPWA